MQDYGICLKSRRAVSPVRSSVRPVIRSSPPAPERSLSRSTKRFPRTCGATGSWTTAARTGTTRSAPGGSPPVAVPGRPSPTLGAVRPAHLPRRRCSPRPPPLLSGVAALRPGPAAPPHLCHAAADPRPRILRHRRGGRRGCAGRRGPADGGARRTDGGGLARRVAQWRAGGRHRARRRGRAGRDRYLVRDRGPRYGEGAGVVRAERGPSRPHGRRRRDHLLLDE